MESLNYPGNAESKSENLVSLVYEALGELESFGLDFKSIEISEIESLVARLNLQTQSLEQDSRTSLCDSVKSLVAKITLDLKRDVLHEGFYIDRSASKIILKYRGLTVPTIRFLIAVYLLLIQDDENMESIANELADGKKMTDIIRKAGGEFGGFLHQLKIVRSTSYNSQRDKILTDKALPIIAKKALEIRSRSFKEAELPEASEADITALSVRNELLEVMKSSNLDETDLPSFDDLLKILKGEVKDQWRVIKAFGVKIGITKEILETSEFKTDFRESLAEADTEVYKNNYELLIVDFVFWLNSAASASTTVVTNEGLGVAAT